VRGVERGRWAGAVGRVAWQGRGGGAAAAGGATAYMSKKNPRGKSACSTAQLLAGKSLAAVTRFCKQVCCLCRGFVCTLLDRNLGFEHAGCKFDEGSRALGARGCLLKL